MTLGAVVTVFAVVAFSEEKRARELSHDCTFKRYACRHREARQLSGAPVARTVRDVGVEVQNRERGG